MNRIRLRVCNRHEIQSFIPFQNYIVISVSTLGDAPPKIPAPENRKGLLRLVFHDSDVDMPEIGIERFTLFQANEILEFVESHKEEIELIICQCDAGRSRSAGIAAALAKILHDDDDFFFRKYTPNMRVYRTILDAHTIRSA